MQRVAASRDYIFICFTTFTRHKALCSTALRATQHKDAIGGRIGKGSVGSRSDVNFGHEGTAAFLPAYAKGKIYT